MARGNRFEVLGGKRPGQRGTRRLLAEYGDRLHYVRYLRDRLTGERFKTVELVVDSAPRGNARIPEDRVVGVKVALHERDLRARVKAAGGIWDPHDRVWLVRYGDLAGLGLSDREFTVREEAGSYAT